jgi:hypothetical protein
VYATIPPSNGLLLVFLSVLAGLRPITSLGRRKAMNQVISLLIGAIVIIVLVYVLLTLL